MSTTSPYDAVEDLLLRAMAIEDRQVRRRWAEELLQGQPEKLAELLSLTEAAEKPAWFVAKKVPDTNGTFFTPGCSWACSYVAP